MKETNGHAVEMTKSSRCSQPLTIGSTIMGMKTVYSIDRSIAISDQYGDPVANGSRYSYDAGQYAIEVVKATTDEEYLIDLTSVGGSDSISISGAGLVNGGCSNSRFAATWEGAATKITIPTYGNSILSFRAAWTAGQNQAIKISDPFYLYPPVDIVPSPTLAPTVAPPKSSETGTIQTLSELPTDQKTGVSILIGIIAVIIVSLSIYAFAWYRASHPYDNTHISDKRFTFTRLTETLAAALTFVALVLVSVLATNRDGPYLGKPDWDSNIFAWHPVLMVAGFFFAQVCGIISWTFIPMYDFAKYSHIIAQVAAFTTMISGIWAIWEYKSRLRMPSYTTVHGWIGMSTVVMYVVTFVWGSTMAVLTRYFPDSILRQVFDLKTIHKQVALMTFSLTSMTIVSGLMDKFSATLCTPVLSSTEDYETDAAKYYPHVPDACKVANGLGVIILMIMFLITFGVSYRGDSFGLTKLKIDSNTIERLKQSQLVKNSVSSRDGDEENQQRARKQSKVPADESDAEDDEESASPLTNNNNNQNFNRGAQGIAIGSDSGSSERETMASIVQRAAEEQERALQRKIAEANNISAKGNGNATSSPSKKSPTAASAMAVKAAEHRKNVTLPLKSPVVLAKSTKK